MSQAAPSTIENENEDTEQIPQIPSNERLGSIVEATTVNESETADTAPIDMESPAGDESLPNNFQLCFEKFLAKQPEFPEFEFVDCEIKIEVEDPLEIIY